MANWQKMAIDMSCVQDEMKEKNNKKDKTDKKDKK